MSEDVWVVDDDVSIRWVLEKALEQNHIPVKSFSDGDSAAQALDYNRPAVIMTDIRMPGTDGFGLLETIQERFPEVPVIIMTAHTDLDSALSSYQKGAFEYLPKPFDIDEAISLINRARAQSVQHQQGDGDSTGSGAERANLIGAAPAMQKVFRAIGRLSASDMNVLIGGESGTGKELVSKALHDSGSRSDKPFVAINMAAIPSELLESELFGHEKGAFTGAVVQRKGRFEQAHGGTLFMDEIGDMPASLQTRLLRVLSEGRFFRVGGHQQIEVDVRIIAATNQNLESLVSNGTFREDLYHRLNVIKIQIPPLRERREDIRPLVEYFMGRCALELGVETKRFESDAMVLMDNHSWPGNVRQLENVCRWLTVMAPGRSISPEDLPEEIHDSGRGGSPGSDWESMLRQHVRVCLNRGDRNILNKLGRQFEKLMIEAALAHTGGHKQEAARSLGWGRNTLTRKLRELDIHPRFGK